LLGFLGVGLAQLMRQLWTLVVLVLEPGAPPATCDVSAALEGLREHRPVFVLGVRSLADTLRRAIGGSEGAA